MKRRNADARGYVPRGGFPLGKTGGLIEAVRRGSSVAALVAGFRWVKPAASLKHSPSLVSPPIVTSMFPLGKTGGLIEAVHKGSILLIEKCWFPLGKTGGLIEAYECGT